MPSSGATVETKIGPCFQGAHSLSQAEQVALWATLGTLEDKWKAIKGFSWQHWLPIPHHTSHTHPVLVAFPHFPGCWIPWPLAPPDQQVTARCGSPQEEANGRLILI